MQVRIGLMRAARPLLALGLAFAAPVEARPLEGVIEPVPLEAVPADAPTGAPDHPRVAEAIETFMLERGMAPFWLEPGMGRAEALIATLRDAGSHGLVPARYKVEALALQVDALGEAPAPDALNDAERALSAAFVRFTSDLRAGAVDPAALGPKIKLRPRRPDPLAVLREGARVSDPALLMPALSPPDAGYRRLRDELARLTALAARGGWGGALAQRSLKPGEVSADVEALRRRLMASGDLPPEPDASVALPGAVAAYDDRLMGAVARFQDRHGLAADGLVGPKTLAALNQPLERRIAQVMLNLERRRWLDDVPTGRRIEVNQAAFRMTVFDEADTPLHEARVVIGKQKTRYQTPEFQNRMSYLVLNPRWNVPRSISVREFLPAVKADASFFETNDMLLLRSGQPVKPADIDWAAMTPEEFGEHYRVVQKPGPQNALGNVKFMFPNGHNIYLHDTPSKHLFSTAVRTHSHGCVRVERPFALAWLLMRDQVEEPGAEIERILEGGEETEVPLERPIPIRLFYSTAWVAHDGVLHFREDVYGRDEALARALRDLGNSAPLLSATDGQRTTDLAPAYP